MVDQEAQDYQDYLDYQEYQKHIGQSAQPQTYEEKRTAALGPDTSLKSQARYDITHMAEDPKTKFAFESGLGGGIPASAVGEGAAAAKNAATGAASKLQGFLEPAAQRSEVLGKVKNIEQLEPYVAEKIGSAKQAFNQKQVGSRMLEQESRLKGNTVRINPNELKGVHPELDAYLNKVAIHNPSGLADEMAQSIEIPAEEAIKIRQMLNESAGWKMHPTDPARAQAQDAKVAGLHQKISGLMSQIDPATAQLSQEMQGAYGLQKAAFGSGKNPVSKITSASPAQQSRIAQVDEAAGSNLGQLGKNIKTAQDRLEPMTLSDLFSLRSPKVIANKAGQIAGRTYDAVAAKAHSGLSKLLSPEAKQIGRNVTPEEISAARVSETTQPAAKMSPQYEQELAAREAEQASGQTIPNPTDEDLINLINAKTGKRTPGRIPK